MKQTKLWLTTIAALLCSLTASAQDFSVGGIYYDITSSTALTVAVTYRGTYYDSYTNEYSGAVTIPSTVTYNSKTYSVTSIRNYAFRDCSSLTSITIPESVTSIGSYAFYNCSSLTSITLPESVTSIGSYAFYNCSKLYKVINKSNLLFAKGLSTYGSVAYYAKVLWQEGHFTTVGDFLFHTANGVHSLVDYIGEDTEIVFPDKYNGESYNIGGYALYNCSNLTSITIPEGVTSIEYSAFDGCTSLKEIVFEDGSETLSLGYNYYSSGTGQGLFYDCPLESVYLGRNLSYDSSESCGYSPFYNKSKLTTLTIGENVTNIENYAFYNCSSLTSITIPESVTSIGKAAFDGCTSLKEIVFEDGNETLSLGYNYYYSSGTGEGLFYDCPLENVYLGRNLSYDSSESCGYSPFYKKTKLTTLTIPEGVTSIGNSAFSGCSSLTSITIPEGVTSIGNSAFSGCSSLTSITIPEGVTSIGSYAFRNCSSLTSITIPEGVTSIGSSAFSDCVNLTSITLPESVTSIEDYAFNRCLSLASLTIPEKVTSIGEHAFFRCISLASITIPESVTSIGGEAFYGCDDLYSVTIGSGVQSFGYRAFSTPKKVVWLTNTPPTGYANAKGDINYVANDQYTSLSNVKVYPYLSSMFEVDGVKYVPVSPSDRTCHAIDCAYDSTATVINVGETASFKGVAMKVTEVMPYAFYGNNHIKEVSISHLGNIGVQAFCRCDGIEMATITNYIPATPSVDDVPLTFADWISTNHSSNSTSSETYTFTAKEGTVLSFDWWVSCESGYDGLIVTLDGTTILAMSGSLNGTYSNAISKGSHTLVVKYTKDASDSSGSDQASVSNITVGKGGAGVGSAAFFDCSSLRTVTLGDGVGSLGDRAFYQCTSLQEIVIPDSVKSVGTYCFSGCSAMKSAATGDGVGSIAPYTFENCTTLEDVVIGDGVTAISSYAFQNCSSLPEINIPQATTTIGDYAFQGCSKLSDVIIEDRTTALSLESNGSSALFVDCPLDSVYIGGKITYSTTSSKGYSPFYRNTSLRSVVITDREEQIYDNEFYGCTNLKNVTIGNGVKSIGDYAFSGCSSLDGFSFGSNMESIGTEAFSDCTNLTSITSHAAVPPTCGTQALDDINKWSCTLRVPQNYATAYQAADQWKEFFFIEDVVEVERYILTYVVDGEVYHTDTLVHKATIVQPETPVKEGYTFSGWSEILETMPANDVTISGTFAVNKYLVTFTIGEEVIAADSLEYGAAIVAPEAPEKDGYTFNGWGEVAETVPANDVTYEGSYSVNSYLLTYTIDGETVQTDSVAYGTAITLLDEPTKDGYTFSGWSEAPETMPAEDVTISGTFTVNIYKVYYYVGEELVHTAEVAYGEAIPEYIYEPTGEGDVFEGWVGDTYETMPAHDVTYVANITNGIDAMSTVNGQQTTVIYDLTGRKVTDTENLKGGIYIINGRKVVIK